jgi:hypothetical protein
MSFQEAFETWMHRQIAEERNPRRRERLNKGLGPGEMALLQRAWYPAVGHFDHLHAEWEVKDANGRYRYIDFAYFPGGNAKGALEAMGYGPHARDMSVGQFKDQCVRHALLALDDWLLLPIAYPSLVEDPKFCQQLILAFVGKFQSMDMNQTLNWVEAETVRFARRCLRPFDAEELARHLRVSPKYARTLLKNLVNRKWLIVASGNQRYRTFMFPVEGWREEGRSPKSPIPGLKTNLLQ